MPLVPLSEDNPEGRPRGLQRLSAEDEAPDYSDENLTAFANAGAARTIDNVAGIPDMLLRGAVGDSMTTGVGLLRHGVHGIRRNFLGEEDLPARPPRIIEGTPIKDWLPSGEEVVAGMKAIGPSTMEEELARDREIAEQNPIATTFGELGGDVATLLGLRSPLKGGRAGGVLDEPIEKAVGSFSRRAGAKAGATGVLKQTKDVLDDERFRILMRGAGRSLETGAEAAFLEMLTDGDPAEAAGLAMGGQALSSGALTIGNGVVEIPFRIFGSGKMGKFEKAAVGLAIHGAIATSLLSFLQSNPEAAEETAYDKLTGAALLAMTLGLPGKRPKDDGLLRNFPQLADAILTIPRTAMIDTARYIAEDPVVADVMAAVAESPEAFGQSRVEEIDKAIREGKPQRIREMYDSSARMQELVSLPANLRDVPTQRRRRDRGPGFER